MKKLITNLVLKAVTSKTSQNVGLAVIITKVIMDLGGKFLPEVPWEGTLQEVILYVVGLLIAVVTTNVIGRGAAEVRDPGKLGKK